MALVAFLKGVNVGGHRRLRPTVLAKELERLDVVSLHQREMKAITYLGQLEKLLGVPLTTRHWNTILGIGRVLRGSTRVPSRA